MMRGRRGGVCRWQIQLILFFLSVVTYLAKSTQLRGFSQHEKEQLGRDDNDAMEKGTLIKSEFIYSYWQIPLKIFPKKSQKSLQKTYRKFHEKSWNIFKKKLGNIFPQKVIEHFSTKNNEIISAKNHGNVFHKKSWILFRQNLWKASFQWNLVFY